ncbi:sporulation protein YqfC [Natroniella sulfidigena]|uniref:sporulation protein YqfC n=1 Tax=Natroniella sulfidigena TaxID=723921 RepID=UPI00200A770A|nr:sporulation protein YqfC [Natroniella sulfidigena]MCK8815925.1 sporulation protein YqfC [Natroniella sulfidigena]
MGRKEEVKAKITEMFNLPQDVVLNLPRLVLIGNLDLLIENHRGIIYYSPELIKVRIYHGLILIEGSELLIEELDKDTIVINGVLNDFSFKLD